MVVKESQAELFFTAYRFLYHNHSAEYFPVSNSMTSSYETQHLKAQSCCLLLQLLFVQSNVLAGTPLFKLWQLF